MQTPQTVDFNRFASLLPRMLRFSNLPKCKLPAISQLLISNVESRFEVQGAFAIVPRFQKGCVSKIVQAKLMNKLTTVNALIFAFILLVSGCGTTTQKFATEQLLISDAVDQAIDEIDFSFLADRSVFLDTTYIKSVKGSGFANIDYIVSALREQMAAAGCRIQENQRDAQIIIEPRVGALGTDGHEVTYGIQTGHLATAAAAFANAPVVPAIPEISFGKSDKQLGVAKIMLFAYDRETKVAVWQSGLRQSESSSTNTWVLGAGPIQRGSIHDGFKFAGKEIRHQENGLNGQRFLSEIRDETAEPKDTRIADEKSGGSSDLPTLR